eukprot:7626989-Alexandrium_andersonii.AAC.1
MDADLQSAFDADSEEAWKAMAEGRLRWGTRGAISARVSMARRILVHDIQSCRAAPVFPPVHWPEGVGME